MTAAPAHALRLVSLGLSIVVAACEPGIGPRDWPSSAEPGSADAAAPSTPDTGESQELRTALQPDAQTLHVGDSIVFRAWVVADGERRVTSVPEATLSSTQPAVVEIQIDEYDRGESIATLTALAPGTAAIDARLGALEASTVHIEVLSAGSETEPETEPESIDWNPATCCPGASRAESDKNLCYLLANTPGCPMTEGDGYCDQDGDGNFATPDDSGWIRGYEEASRHCAGYEPEIDLATCCPLATRGPDDKNFCYIPPDTPGCPMTADQGYCDQDGDDAYSTPNDSGWAVGHREANALCN